MKTLLIVISNFFFFFQLNAQTQKDTVILIPELAAMDFHFQRILCLMKLGYIAADSTALDSLHVGKDTLVCDLFHSKEMFIAPEEPTQACRCKDSNFTEWIDAEMFNFETRWNRFNNPKVILYLVRKRK